MMIVGMKQEGNKITSIVKAAVLTSVLAILTACGGGSNTAFNSTDCDSDVEVYGEPPTEEGVAGRAQLATSIVIFSPTGSDEFSNELGGFTDLSVSIESVLAGETANSKWQWIWSGAASCGDPDVPSIGTVYIAAIAINAKRKVVKVLEVETLGEKEFDGALSTPPRFSARIQHIVDVANDPTPHRPAPPSLPSGSVTAVPVPSVK